MDETALAMAATKPHPFVFSLDRAVTLRRDDEALAAARRDARARTLLLIEMKPWVSKHDDGRRTINWLSGADIERFELAREAQSFIGLMQDGTPVFFIAITEHRARVIPAEPGTFSSVSDLRTLAVTGSATPDEVATVGVAHALAQWHRAQRCCGLCGGANKQKEGGWRLRCWACGQNHHPRYEPCVIMLVHDGERCVLGHEARFPDKLYSTLAGFIEPGEDIEEAVVREVEEEVGIRPHTVNYAASQPWPFPHSLMIGCLAQAAPQDLTIDPEEIVDAQWFDRDTVRTMLAGRHPEGLVVPGPYSLAHMLISRFAEG